MKKINILEIIEGYRNHDEVPEIEKNVNLVHLKRILERFFIINAVLSLVVGILVIINLVTNYKDKKILDKVVSFRDGEITEKIKILNTAREALSITEAELIEIKKERYYNTFAGGIIEYYYNQNKALSFRKVKEVLKAIDEFVPQYFPNGPFTVDDFYSICAVESNFDHKCIGKKGERGFFQILAWKECLKEINKTNADPYDPWINTEMACYTLKEKYEKYHDKKTALIAYNGYIKDKDGKLIENYWHRFRKYKNEIRKIKQFSKNF